MAAGILSITVSSAIGAAADRARRGGDEEIGDLDRDLPLLSARPSREAFRHLDGRAIVQADVERAAMQSGLDRLEGQTQL